VLIGNRYFVSQIWYKSDLACVQSKTKYPDSVMSSQKSRYSLREGDANDSAQRSQDVREIIEMTTKPWP
jgi:hypothetical protein